MVNFTRIYVFFEAAYLRETPVCVNFAMTGLEFWYLFRINEKISPFSAYFAYAANGELLEQRYDFPLNP